MQHDEADDGEDDHVNAQVMALLSSVPTRARTSAMPGIRPPGSICAVSVVSFTNWVGSATPLNRMTAPCAKPLPLTVSVNCGSLAPTLPGLSDVRSGASFCA